MQKVLILGATGFLGRHFVQAAEANKKLELFKLNSKKYNLLTNQIFELNKVKFDYIFHFAVHTKAAGYSQRHPGQQFLINQKINSTVLNYWKDVQPQAKLIAFGTGYSYSSDISKVEENYLHGQCESGFETYGMTKRMLFVGVNAIAKEYDMKYIFYVPSCFYGEGYDKDDRHFICDLVRKICDAKYKSGSPVVLWGDGHQRRDLIYVKDAVDVLLKNLHKENEVYNLSTGVDCSIREYAKMICDIVEYDFKLIKFDTTKFVGARERKLNVDKLNYSNFTDLRTGLKKVVDFYTQNYMGKS